MRALMILLKKELLDVLRDRRTLMVMIVVPVIIYPAMLPLMGLMMSSGKERLARQDLKVAVIGADAAKLIGSASLPHTEFVAEEQAAAEAGLKEKKLSAVVIAEPGAANALTSLQHGRVTVEYTKRHDSSTEARDRVVKLLRAVDTQTVVARVAAANLPADFGQPLEVDQKDIEFGKNIGPEIASTILPMLLVMVVFMGASSTAIDLTAGEKERGTLETLLLAPVEAWQPMTAKYLAVFAVALFTAFLNLGMMGLMFGFGLKLDSNEEISLQLGVGQVSMIILALLPFVALMCAIALALGSMAKSTKEGQTLVTPLVFISMIPGFGAMAPGMELGPGTAWIPLLNVGLLMKGAVLATAHWVDTAIVVGSTSALAVLAVAIAANAFRSEALRFGGTEGWKDLFRFSW